MKNNDISYYNEGKNTVFNFRVGMIAVNDNKILLQKSDNNDYYSLIGGRVKLNETTFDALIRELYEETGVKVDSNEIKLIKVVENFFIHNNKKFHELLYIYKVNNELLNKMDNFKTIDKDNSYNKWFDVAQINNMNIKPEFLKKWYLEDSLSHEIID